MSIINDVIKRDIVDYERATQAEIDQLRRSAAVVSIYSTGMTKAPGISDLDLIVVLDLDRTQGSLRQALKHSLVTANDPYIRMHPIFVVSPALFQKVRWLADLSTLECVYGEDVDVDPVPEQYAEILRAISVLEIGTHKLFAMRQMLLSNQPSARNLLLTLNSISYSLLLAGKLSTTKIAHRSFMENFRDEVQQLRASWFEDPSIESLRRLIEKFPELLCQAFDAASTCLIQALDLVHEEKLNGRCHLAIEPAGNVLVDGSQQTCSPSVFKPSFYEWAKASHQRVSTAFRGPVGLAIPFAYCDLRLRSEPKQHRHYTERAQLDSSLLDWCLSSRNPLRHGLEQRTDLMCHYAHWYRPYWGYGFPFSPYTSWLVGPRTWGERLRNKIDRSLIRSASKVLLRN